MGIKYMNIKLLYQETKTGKQKTVIYRNITKRQIEKSLESQAKRGWFIIGQYPLIIGE